MAAPILSKHQKAACLSKTFENCKKVKFKNVLCGESQSWPKPSREVEELIVLKLSEIFKGLPNIFKPVQNASKKDQEAKRKVRFQLDVGTNCVCRSLEKDRLSCVLVSGKVTPAAAVDHVIAVARERGCPLLCLDSLSTTLAKVTKSKCLPVCIGFKKLTSGSELSDFVDVISLVQQHTTVRKHHRSVKKVGARKKDVQTTLLSESLRPIILDASTDNAVRDDLKRIFANAAFKESENKMLTSKDKKRKKNKKKKVKQYYRKWLHNQFESGKKTVTDFVGQGKVQLVLVIRELLPVLMSEHPTSSLLCVARDQDCPVLCVSNLAMVMSADSAKALSVLGIKKESSLPMNTQSVFSSVIEKCLDFMRSAPMPTQDMDFEDLASANNDALKESILKQTGSEEQDYSFMYVMKTESAELKEKALKFKQEQDNMSKQMTFNSDFISFGGGDSSGLSTESNSLLGKRKSKKPLTSALLKPKKMNLDTQTQADVSGNPQGFISFGDLGKNTEENMSANTGQLDLSSTPSESSTLLFSVSRAGNKSQKPSQMEEDNDNTSGSSAVLGLNESQMSANAKDKEMEHVSNIFSATTRKGKGEDKKRHGQEGFVSFAYTEANIHTMVSNPLRKKKGGKK